MLLQNDIILMDMKRKINMIDKNANNVFMFLIRIIYQLWIDFP